MIMEDFPLQPQQVKVMKFLTKYYKQKKYMPSYEEIMKHTGHKSKSRIAAIMDQLVKIKRKREGKFNFIEIGCNKATDAVMKLRMFTQNPRVDLKIWLERTQFVKQPSCNIDWELWKKIQGLTSGKKIQGLAFDYRHYCIEPVSYTHLRAHETDSYLVCRLLLEKKKNYCS